MPGAEWKRTVRSEAEDSSKASAASSLQLTEAVPLLRKYKDGKLELPDIVVSATDPLNLVGIILPGERITAMSARILFGASF